MLIHWYRVGAGSLNNNFVGTQTLTVNGDRISTGYCPPNSLMPPNSRQASSQRLPFAANVLQRLGGYSQLHMPGSRTPTYIAPGTTPFWQLLTQQMNGQSGDYHSVSNPMFQSGTPQNVVQHTLANPTEYTGSGTPANPAIVTGETLMLTGTDPSPYPVCNLQQNRESQSAQVTCSRGGLDRRNFMQFTPMTGRYNSFAFDGVGFVNTDDGLYAFFPAFLRGGSFSCKPQDDHTSYKNDTDNDPHASYRIGWPDRMVIPLVLQYSAR